MNGETGVERRVRAVEMDCAAQRASVRVMHEALEDHEKRLRAIEELAPLLKINQFILMGLGGSLIALIWGLLTGQVRVVF